MDMDRKWLARDENTFTHQVFIQGAGSEKWDVPLANLQDFHSTLCDWIINNDRNHRLVSVLERFRETSRINLFFDVDGGVIEAKNNKIIVLAETAKK